MQTKIAVVILNWNGKAFLEKFIPSVLQNNIPGSKIIVADNASNDDSIPFLHNHFPEVEIIRNLFNGGFAEGYNEALKKVDAEYFILLNSDVEVSPGWIEPLVSLMDSDKNIAACQPKIKSYKDQSHFEHAGAAGGFIDKYGYPFCRGRIFNNVEPDTGQYENTTEIFWASGACMCVRSETFRLAEGFDADFFAHMEEIDLCWRMKNMGYKIMFSPHSVVYHVGGGTLSSGNPRKTFLNFQNNLVLICKNHSEKYFWIKLFIRFLMDGAAGIKFFLDGDFSHTWAVIRAHFSFYRSFSGTYAKRKALQKRIKHYSKTGVYNRSIVADYYLRGITRFSELNQKYFS